MPARRSYHQLPDLHRRALASDQLVYDANLRPPSTRATWRGGSGTSGAVSFANPACDPASNVTSLATTPGRRARLQRLAGSERQNSCYDEQNRLGGQPHSGTQPGAGNGTCGTATLSNTLVGPLQQHLRLHPSRPLWQGPATAPVPRTRAGTATPSRMN